MARNLETFFPISQISSIDECYDSKNIDIVKYKKGDFYESEGKYTILLKKFFFQKSRAISNCQRRNKKEAFLELIEIKLSLLSFI